MPSDRSGPPALHCRIVEVEGVPVRCIEMADGATIWLYGCERFRERATRHPEGVCEHTAVAIVWAIEDRSRRNADLTEPPPSGPIFASEK